MSKLEGTGVGVEGGCGNCDGVVNVFEEEA